ncbi:ADP-ribose pyrophosphatase YjhB, NUDIX family [Nonomuraea maritima]|uniref:ADP-ribose pyrophosphatase YjhB, NUDIX family n=1 Tax=Nonomuraea maritima TaxID=683260 RepID=A0A1G8XVI3_9ACTN|nr:NUDIX domain-containing protein [Nonomuraea maritima]SDJ94523.1 ADP-ribose pyrophosphatase YjhB, NUDIX family [Nonomuraea maritima]
MITRIERPAARLILADPRGLVLLFRFIPPEPWPREHAWHLPGGGLEPGETPAQAAAREALEETGHVLDPAALGEPVAVNEGTWSNQGRHYHTETTFFFARVAAATVAPTVAGDYADEDWLNGNRWWSAQELADTKELVFPPGLAAMVPGLLSGARPAQPVRLSWRHD